MAGGLFSRIKNWALNEVLKSSDVNAEFNNIINNCDSAHIGGYSSNSGQMQQTTNPGTTGSESLATSNSDELQRLRYVIKRILGSGATNWYDPASADLTSLSSFVSNPSNRIVSGAVSADGQPAFLVATGSANSVTLKCASTHLVCYINGVLNTVSSDITISGLSLAPGSNNTTTIVYDGDPVTLAAWAGEKVRNIGDRLAYDLDPINGGMIYHLQFDPAATGSQFANYDNKIAAISIVDGAVTEYCIGVYDGAAKLMTHMMRGAFFDSTGASIGRVVPTNGDSITLMKLAYIFYVSGGALDATYNTPTSSATAPSSPSTGDYWYDQANNTWKKYTGAAFVVANAIPVGLVILDSANAKAARSSDFYGNYRNDNSVEVMEATGGGSANYIFSTAQNSRVSVYGSLLLLPGRVQWLNTNMESGTSLSSSRTAFLYMKNNGDTIVSTIAPNDRFADLGGFYHPAKPWRCLGAAQSDGTGFTNQVISYGQGQRPPSPKRQVFLASVSVTISHPLASKALLNAAATSTGFYVMGRGKPLMVGFDTYKSAVSTLTTTQNNESEVDLVVYDIQTGNFLENLTLASISSSGSVNLKQQITAVTPALVSGHEYWVGLAATNNTSANATLAIGSGTSTILFAQEVG